MLLLHPPHVKACEPPAALAYLAASLKAHDIMVRVIDLNIKCQHALFQESYEPENAWAKRALKNCGRNIEALQAAALYKNRDRYKRAIADLNKVMDIAGKNAGLQLSLANYQDNTLSPLCIDDLRKAAADYKENIYYPCFSRHLKDLIADKPPAVIGLSLNFLSQALCAFSIIGYLKATYPTTKIVVGGGLATTWLNHPDWNHPFKGLIDLFIGGRGERPLLKLLGKEDRNTINLPDYTIFPLADYLAPGTIIPYTTSFGCFWKKCNFCPEASENNLYSHTPPATSTRQLQQLREKHSPILFHLLDNALSNSTLRAFTHSKPNVPWYGFARFDKLLANPDFCKRLAQSGCVMLKLGLESGDQNVLDEMNKGITLSQVTTILHNLKAAGIGTYIYLLFGTPAEDYDRARNTMQFIKRHSETINYLNLAIFNMPRGSVDKKTAKLLKVRDFYKGDLSIYQDFTHPKGWGRAEIRRFLDHEFKKNNSIGQIMQADPPQFTSNHAPFLLKKQAWLEQMPQLQLPNPQ